MPHNGADIVIYEIFKTEEFMLWFQQQNLKTQLIIDGRLDRIECEGHWDFTNRFDELIELKWTSGMRIYTSLLNGKIVIILGGGNKNGQSKDIKKAKSLLKQITDKT